MMSVRGSAVSSATELLLCVAASDLQKHIFEVHLILLQPSELEPSIDDDFRDHAAVSLAVGQHDADSATVLFRLRLGDLRAFTQQLERALSLPGLSRTR